MPDLWKHQAWEIWQQATLRPHLGRLRPHGGSETFTDTCQKLGLDPFEQRLMIVILLLGADAEMVKAEFAMDTLLKYQELFRYRKPRVNRPTIYDLSDEEFVDHFYELWIHMFHPGREADSTHCAIDF